MKNNILRLLSFLLGILIIVLIPVLFFRTKIINAEYCKELFRNNGAEDELYEKTDSAIKLSYVNNGVSVRKYKFEVNKEMLYNDFLDNVDNLFDYLKGNISNVPAANVDKYSIQFDKDLSNNINSNVTLNEEVVANTKNDVMKNISGKIDVLGINKYATSNGFLKNIQEIIEILNSNSFLWGVICAIIFDVIFMICINRRKFIKYVAYGITGSSIIIGVISFSGYLSKMYYNSPIGMKFLQKSIGDIIKACFVNMTIVSCMGLVIGTILLILNYKISNMNNVCD